MTMLDASRFSDAVSESARDQLDAGLAASLGIRPVQQGLQVAASHSAAHAEPAPATIAPAAQTAGLSASAHVGASVSFTIGSVHLADAAAIRAGTGVDLDHRQIEGDRADAARVDLGVLTTGSSHGGASASTLSAGVAAPHIEALLAAGLAPDGVIAGLAQAIARGGRLDLAQVAGAAHVGLTAPHDGDSFDSTELYKFKNGIDQAFGALSAAIANQVLIESLPLVGTQLQPVFATLDRIATYQSGIDNALNAFAAAATHDTAMLNSLLHSNLGDALASLINAGYDAASNSYTLSFSYGGSANQLVQSVDLDTHLGLPGFNFNTSGSATDTSSYALSLNVGESGGAFSFANGGVDFGFDVTAPNVSSEVNLGFLKFGVGDAGSDVNGHFNVGLSYNGAFTSTVNLSGGANLNLLLTGEADIIGTPQISANLLVNWGFDGTTNFGDVTHLGSSAPTVTFQDVKYDFGSFMSDFVKPILDDLTPVFKPLQEALAVFHTDLSFLSVIPGIDAALHLNPGDPITLLDFASLVLPADQVAEIKTVLDVVQEVVDAASALEGISFGAQSYDLGTTVLPIANDLRVATNFLSGLKSLNLGSLNISNTEDLASFIHGLSGAGWNAANPGQTMGTDAAVQATGQSIAEELILGDLFKFPILTNPSQVFGILFGQNADLFQLKMPTLDFGLGKIDASGNPTQTKDLFTIPILPGISVDFSAAFDVSINLLFGYDTHGMQQFATDHNVLDLLNGFYIDDQRSGTGVHATDIPEITLAAALEVALKAGLPGISFTGGGNITGQLYLDLDNALSDSQGRVHLDAMGHALTTDPFGIFDVSGRITAGLNAYVTLFGANIWQTNSGRITLADFSTGHVTIQPGGGSKPVVNVPLAELSGDTLTLHVGALAGLRTGISDHTDDSEVMYVGLSGGSAQVAGFNHTDVYTLGGGGLAHISAGGGAGDDTLSVDNTVQAAATLDGGDGNDFLYGGGGGDSLTGGAGRDYIEGGDGADSINGGADNDVLVGGKGADTIDGGGGDFDIISYHTSTAAVNINLATGVNTGGDATGDVLTNFAAIEGSDAAALKDTLTGGSGNDIFYGLRGNDSLSGGAGNDILVGGLGADTMDGGDGSDSASYIGAAGGVIVGPNGGTAGEAAGDVLKHMEQIEGSQYDDQLTGGNGIFSLLGQYGNDTLVGGAENDILNGGLGADALNGGGGIDEASYRNATVGVVLNLSTGGTGGEATGDTFSSIERVDGSDHNDNITGDVTASTLYGWAGGDTLVGQGGNDLILGGDGNDSISAGAGDDTVYGGAGADKVDGGAGRDTVTYRDSLASLEIDMGKTHSTGIAIGDTFTGVEVIEGSDWAGAGDTILGTAGANVLSGIGGDDVLVGAGGDDTLLGGAGNDTLTSTTGNDSISGGDGADSINAGDGTNHIDGGTGADSITSGVGNDLITGGDDADLISAGAGNNSVDGGAGADSIATLGGSDTITGGTENDTIWAGSGNDSLDGQAGDDQVNGEAGADTIIASAGNDAFDGGADRDLITYAAATGGVVLNLGSALTYAGHAYAAGAASADGFGGHDTVVNVEDAIGSSHNDLMIAADGGSSLMGMAGVDTLVGQGGNDTLNGGGGADSLDGGGGLHDFATYENDVAGVTANLTTGKATDGAHASDTLVNIEGLIGSAFNDALTGGAGPDFLFGGDGNDTLTGAAGADYMSGGAGNDTYYVDSLADVVSDTDTMTGHAGGTDLIIASLDYSIAALADIENLTLSGAARSGIGNDGSNVITGTIGNDTLDGRGGADLLQGGKGDDVYILDTPDSSAGLGDRVVENPGGGTDTVEFHTALFTNGFTLDMTQAWLANVENATLLDNDQAFSFIGNNLGDHIVNNVGNSLFQMGTGDDAVTVLGGNDTAHFGAGTDTLIVNYAAMTTNVGSSFGVAADGSFQGYYADAAGDIVYFDGAERLNITTGSGNDDIVTGNAVDTISTGAGDDVIHSGMGADIIDAGSGNNGWEADKSDATVDITLNLQTATYSGPGSALGIDYIYNTFETGSGNDVIVMPTFTDSATISTNAGSDTVTVVAGNDTIHFGSGATGGGSDPNTDKLIINYAALTTNVGSSFGVAPDGSFQGYYADAAGNIIYFDGVERLNITTGSGNDDIVTGNALDTISTGAGNDVIHSGMGADIIDAGSGNNGWEADKSDATVNITLNLQTATYSGPGSALGIDYIFNTFETGSGNDVIVMPTFTDSATISTNAGSDTVTVVAGNDTIHFGSGATGGGSDPNTDKLIIHYAAMTTNVGSSFGVAPDGSFQGYYADAAGNIVYFDGAERLDITTGSGNDDIVTGNAVDTISTGAGDDVIHSGMGADIIDAGSGKNGWEADKSDATVNITLNLQTATYSGPGSALGIDYIYNTFETGSGADVIVMPTFADSATISTNAGSDTVTVVAGNDTIHLGTGATGGGADPNTDKLIIDYAALTTNVGSNFGVGADGSFLGYYADAAGNIVYFDGAELLNIATGSGSDNIVTGDARDTISTGAGDDTISSGKGADVINAGKGVDWWQADKSDATTDINLNLQKGKYSGPGTALSVDAIYQSFATGSGNDTILMPKFGDNATISTNAGDDKVTVVRGNDTIHFGDGTDTLVVSWATLTHAVSTSFGTAADGSFNGFYTDSSNNIVYFDAVERLAVSTGSGNDDVIAGAGNDTIHTGLGDDVIHSGGGVDVVDGGKGFDGWEADLSAATANISLNLQTGKYSGPGSVTGIEYLANGFATGSGADTIVLPTTVDNVIISTNAGADSVTVVAGSQTIHFGAGADKLVVDYHADTAAASSSLSAAGDGSYYGYYVDGSNVVKFDGVETIVITTGSGADSLMTGGGADSITAGAGNDSIDGGDGNDTIVGGSGADVMTGGTGADHFVFTAITDSTPGAPDLITGLDAKDVIDLSAIDAIPGTPADDPFTIVKAFDHHAGELVISYDSTANVTSILLDTNGDATADFVLHITGDDHKFTGFVL